MKALATLVLLLATSLGAPGAARAGTIVDGVGDAVAVFGEPGPLLDIDTLTVTPSGGDLLVSVTFHTPILPASSEAANSLFGGLDFDFDRDPLTGDPPFQNNFPAFAQLEFGSELSVDFFFEGENPGFVGVYDNLSHTLIGTVPVTFTESGVSYDLPMSLTTISGPFYVTAGFGTSAQPTDAMDVFGVVPEPAPLVLLELGIAVLGGAHLVSWRSARDARS